MVVMYPKKISFYPIGGVNWIKAGFNHVSRMQCRSRSWQSLQLF